MGAELVKKDFELFLKKHVPDACLDNVDEIVLDYVAEVLGDLGRGQGESSFDVDQFSEMISAYVPEFSSIECSVVCQWVFELADKQKVVKSRMEDSRIQKPAAPKTEQTSKAKLITKTRGSNGEKSTEDTTSTTDTASGDGEVSLLREMFPSVGEENMSAVLARCQGDVEDAIQQLLALPEENTRGRVMEEMKTRDQKRHLADPSRTEVCGDKDIKESLLARSAFVMVFRNLKIL
jgi:hypothetical protein